MGSESWHGGTLDLVLEPLWLPSTEDQQAMGPEFLGTGERGRGRSVSQVWWGKGKIGGRPPSKMGQGRWLVSWGT